MGFLKWAGAILLSVIVVALFVGGGLLIAVASGILSAIALAAAVIWFVACCIKNVFDSRSGTGDE